MNRAAIFDLRMNDGSRHFAELPQLVFFDRMRDHLKLLDGAAKTEFVTDSVTEMWLGFDYKGHQFSVNNEFGEYWFFVNEPFCPEYVLTAVRNHFAAILPE